MTQEYVFVEWPNYNELQVFISISWTTEISKSMFCTMVAPVLSHFELCSLKYDTFELKVKSVNNLENS